MKEWVFFDTPQHGCIVGRKLISQGCFVGLCCCLGWRAESRESGCFCCGCLSKKQAWATGICFLCLQGVEDSPVQNACMVMDHDFCTLCDQGQAQTNSYPMLLTVAAVISCIHQAKETTVFFICHFPFPVTLFVSWPFWKHYTRSLSPLLF